MEPVFLLYFSHTKGIISVGKLGKTLETLQSKYSCVKHFQPIFVSLRGILERKEKAMIAIIEIIEEMECEDKMATDPDEHPEKMDFSSIRSKARYDQSLMKSPQTSKMGEKELRALALHNLRKKNEDEKSRGTDTYPETIQPLKIAPCERRPSSAYGVRLVKSDPVESSSGFDTQVSIVVVDADEKSRRHSFDAGIFLKEAKVEDPLRRNSCILDYELRPLTATKKVFHNRSMSDNAVVSSCIATIPKNYRYSIKDFQFVKAVNSGSFGKICLVRMIETGELYAMKIINSEEAVASNREAYVESEWNVFRQVNSEYIVRCYYTFYYSKYLCFVMEYLNGGDLSFFLQEYALYEREARIYLAELVLALEYLHDKGIIHRDVKPANILIGSDGHIKLSDFGLSMCTYNKDSVEYSCRSPLLSKSKKSPAISKSGKRVGTAYYMAPEVINDNEVTPDADWWAVGVIAYEMITGQFPFPGETVEEIFYNITNGNMQSYDQAMVSKEANSLFKGLLTMKREERLGHKDAWEIKQHPFFKGINWETIRSEKPPFIPVVKPDDPTFYFPEEKAFSLEEYIVRKEGPFIRSKAVNEKEKKLRIEANLMFRRFSRSNPRPLASKNISSAINVLKVKEEPTPYRKHTFY